MASRGGEEIQMECWEMVTSVNLWLLEDGSRTDLSSGVVYNYHSVKVQVCEREEREHFTKWI